MSTKVFSTHQAAKVCNVHHTTIINWVKEGKILAYTTPGGHRRIKEEDLIDFMKKYKISLPKETGRKIKKVLIVDDDFDFLEELKTALSNRGFELDFTSSGFEAGRKVYSERPDLILLDFKMPGMDGFQVCDILHKDETTVNIPIIAITVLNSEEDIKRIKEYGVKEYMPKPVDMWKLLKTICKILKIKYQDEVIKI